MPRSGPPASSRANWALTATRRRRRRSPPRDRCRENGGPGNGRCSRHPGRDLRTPHDGAGGDRRWPPGHVRSRDDLRQHQALHGASRQRGARGRLQRDQPEGVERRARPEPRRRHLYRLHRTRSRPESAARGDGARVAGRRDDRHPETDSLRHRLSPAPREGRCERQASDRRPRPRRLHRHGRQLGGLTAAAVDRPHARRRSRHAPAS